MQIGLLAEIGVERDRVYIDHAVSGRQAKRPGLEDAIKASREGDELCVTKLTAQPRRPSSYRPALIPSVTPDEGRRE